MRFTIITGQGLDQMFDHEHDARVAVMNALIAFNSINN